MSLICLLGAGNLPLAPQGRNLNYDHPLKHLHVVIQTLSSVSAQAKWVLQIVRNVLWVNLCILFFPRDHSGFNNIWWLICISLLFFIYLILIMIFKQLQEMRVK